MKSGFITFFIAIILTFNNLSAQDSYHPQDPFGGNFHKLSPGAANLITDNRTVHPDSLIYGFYGSYNTKYVLFKKDGEIYTGALVEAKPGFDTGELKKIGALVGTKAGNIISLRLPIAKLEELAQLDGIKYIETDIPVFQELTELIPLLSIDKLHSGQALGTNYTGKGVVLGVIDGGFDFRHQTFYDPEMSFKNVWIQWMDGSAPDNFSYGHELRGSAIENYKTDTDTDSHGTHTTGIAGGSGNAEDNKYIGVAPETDIVAVSYFFDEYARRTTGSSEILDGIKYIFEYASKVGKPAVVNMSLGLHIGPHDGQSLFDQACKELVGPGRIIVSSAGNSGGSESHIKYNFDAPDTLFSTGLGFVDGANLGIFDAWGEPGKDFGVSVCLKSATKEYSADYYYASSNISRNIELKGPNGDRIFIRFYTKDDEFNSKPRVYAEVTSYQQMYSATFIKVKSKNGKLHIWNCGVGGSISGDFFYYPEQGCMGGNDDYLVSELGGNCEDIIAVGAYTTKNRFTNYDGRTYSIPFYTQVGEFASFSSNGPTVDERVKPDICAPGNVVVSAINSEDDTYNYAGAPGWPYLIDRYYHSSGPYFSYASMQGTSMSAPVVSGVVALMLQANPYLDQKQALQIIKSTATNDNFTGNVKISGSYDWGFGKINPVEAVEAAAQMYSPDSLSSNIKIYPVPCGNELTIEFNDIYFGYYVAELFDLYGRSALVEKKQINGAVDYMKLNLSGLSKGCYFLELKNINSTKYYKIIKDRN